MAAKEDDESVQLQEDVERIQNVLGDDYIDVDEDDDEEEDDDDNLIIDLRQDGHSEVSQSASIGRESSHTRSNESGSGSIIIEEDTNDVVSRDSRSHDGGMTVSLPEVSTKSVENTLILNRNYQEIILMHMSQVATALEENRAKQRELACQMEENATKKQTVTCGGRRRAGVLWTYGAPYFRDLDGSRPLPNEDVLSKKRNDEMKLTQVVRPLWYHRDRKILVEAVQQDSLKRLLQPLLSRRELEEEKLAQTTSFKIIELHSRIADIDDELSHRELGQKKSKNKNQKDKRKLEKGLGKDKEKKKVQIRKLKDSKKENITKSKGKLNFGKVKIKREKGEDKCTDREDGNESEMEEDEEKDAEMEEENDSEKETEADDSAVEEENINFLREDRNRLVDELERAIVIQERIDSINAEIEDIRRTPARQLQLMGDPEKIDWLKIAKVDFNGKQEWESLERLWRNVLHPSINRQSWSAEENDLLAELAALYTFRHWDVIAYELGTNRAPFHCLQHYQQTLNPQFKTAWTDRETEWLKLVVPQCRVTNVRICWNKVAFYIEGHSAAQCQQRWKQIDPTMKRGKWTLEEDARLLTAVHIVGTGDWQKLSEFISGRDAGQCRERYVNCLDPHLNLAPWTYEEDKKLMLLVQKYGEGNWAKICAQLPGRTDNNCLHRFQRLKTWQHQTDWYNTLPAALRNELGRDDEPSEVIESELEAQGIVSSDYEKQEQDRRKGDTVVPRPPKIVGYKLYNTGLGLKLMKQRALLQKLVETHVNKLRSLSHPNDCQGLVMAVAKLSVESLGAEPLQSLTQSLVKTVPSQVKVSQLLDMSKALSEGGVIKPESRVIKRPRQQVVRHFKFKDINRKLRDIVFLKMDPRRLKKGRARKFFWTRTICKPLTEEELDQISSVALTLVLRALKVDVHSVLQSAQERNQIYLQAVAATDYGLLDKDFEGPEAKRRKSLTARNSKSTALNAGERPITLPGNELPHTEDNHQEQTPSTVLPDSVGIGRDVAEIRKDRGQRIPASSLPPFDKDSEPADNAKGTSRKVLAITAVTGEGKSPKKKRQRKTYTEADKRVLSRRVAQLAVRKEQEEAAALDMIRSEEEEECMQALQDIAAACFRHKLQNLTVASGDRAQGATQPVKAAAQIGDNDTRKTSQTLTEAAKVPSSSGSAHSVSNQSVDTNGPPQLEVPRFSSRIHGSGQQSGSANPPYLPPNVTSMTAFKTLLLQRTNLLRQGKDCVKWIHSAGRFRLGLYPNEDQQSSKTGETSKQRGGVKHSGPGNCSTSTGSALADGNQAKNRTRNNTVPPLLVVGVDQRNAIQSCEGTQTRDSSLIKTEEKNPLLAIKETTEFKNLYHRFMSVFLWPAFMSSIRPPFVRRDFTTMAPNLKEEGFLKRSLEEEEEEDTEAELLQNSPIKKRNKMFFPLTGGKNFYRIAIQTKEKKKERKKRFNKMAHAKLLHREGISMESEPTNNQETEITTQQEQPSTQISSPTVRRGKGRPKGAKGRPKPDRSPVRASSRVCVLSRPPLPSPKKPKVPKPAPKRVRHCRVSKELRQAIRASLVAVRKGQEPILETERKPKPVPVSKAIARPADKNMTMVLTYVRGPNGQITQMLTPLQPASAAVSSEPVIQRPTKALPLPGPSIATHVADVVISPSTSSFHEKIPGC